MDIIIAINDKIHELESKIIALGSAKEVLGEESLGVSLSGSSDEGVVSSGDLFNSRQHNHKKVYDYVLVNPWKNYEQVAKALSWPKKKVIDVVSRLKRRGLVVCRFGGQFRAYVPTTKDMGGR